MAQKAAASLKSRSTYKLNTPVHASLDRSVHASVDTQKRKTIVFGQLPRDVLKRSDLSSDAKCVFSAVNMSSPGHENVAISLRDLEQLLPFKKSKIGNLLKKLTKAGILEPGPFVPGSVKVYRIKHQNWATVPSKSECPRCGSKAFSIGASGACRKCIDGLNKRLATVRTA